MALEDHQPERRPGQVIDYEPRCWRCGRLLIEYAARPWKSTCGRCKATNASAPDPGAPRAP